MLEAFLLISGTIFIALTTTVLHCVARAVRQGKRNWPEVEIKLPLSAGQIIVQRTKNMKVFRTNEKVPKSDWLHNVYTKADFFLYKPNKIFKRYNSNQTFLD